MSRIKIKNFGPIKAGLVENDGWLEIKKVTIFIGNQGSGKSTLAKVISTMLWVEKALIRGDISVVNISLNTFLELIKYHRLESYLETDTQIIYEGRNYQLSFDMIQSNSAESSPFTAKALEVHTTQLPKIMYVPAERNFLSTVENINKVSSLIVGSLKSFSIELRTAQLESNGSQIELPINNTKVIYNHEIDENEIIFDKKKLRLSHASSGFHAVVPLFWVSQYLSSFVKLDDDKLLKLLSLDQSLRREKELKKINTSNLGNDEIVLKRKEIDAKYLSRYFINIVEEPEQNLFPSSQKKVFYSLLHFNNLGKENQLIITTHSPYIISYLTQAIKAYKVFHHVASLESDNLEHEIDEIVKFNALVAPDEWVVYEMQEDNGTITRLNDYKGLPEDYHFLNNELVEINNNFDKLRQIEKKYATEFF